MAASTLITVAPTGAEADKAAVPALPVTLDELVGTAKECEAAGAAVIHVHIRDQSARPTLDRGRLADTVAALREGTDLILQLSTGGAVTDSFPARLAVLYAVPDACSLTCCTVNFGDDVFANPWGFIKELYQLTQERQVVPEFELFDLGQVATLHRLLGEFGPPAGGHVHCDLVMGVPGGCRETSPRWPRRWPRCRPAPRGPRPGSAGPRCRCCLGRSAPAVTCGSGWRTRCPSPGGAPSPATPNWWNGPRSWPATRSGHRWAPPRLAPSSASRTARLALAGLFATASMAWQNQGMANQTVKSIGDYIREQREQARISMRQLAQQAGVSNPYLSQIERGLRKPSADILAQIAKGLRISAEALYVQAGILEDRPADSGVRSALLADPELSERQKQVLIEIYESFRKENAASAETQAAEATEAAAGTTEATAAATNEAT